MAAEATTRDSARGGESGASEPRTARDRVVLSAAARARPGAQPAPRALIDPGRFLPCRPRRGLGRTGGGWGSGQIDGVAGRTD